MGLSTYTVPYLGISRMKDQGVFVQAVCLLQALRLEDQGFERGAVGPSLPNALRVSSRALSSRLVLRF